MTGPLSDDQAAERTRTIGRWQVTSTRRGGPTEAAPPCHVTWDDGHEATLRPLVATVPLAHRPNPS